jgi:hypothetical protein
MKRKRHSTEGSKAGQAADFGNLPTHPNAPEKATSRRDVANSFVSGGGREGHVGHRKGIGKGKASRRRKAVIAKK